jgi:arylsulfatase A-like enzyme
MSIKLPNLRGGMALVLAALAGVSSSPAQSTNEIHPPAPRRTSIILIVANNLGWGDLGCYGQARIKTPNLDRMATEGVRFVNFYAGSAAQAPARASLLLGLHTGHTDVRGDAIDSDLSSADLTVAQVLKQSGYVTGLIGLWDLGQAGSAAAPQNKGFYEFAGFLNRDEAANDYGDYIWRYNPKQYGLDGTPHVIDGKFPLSQNQGGNAGLYLPGLVSSMATNFIRIYQPDRVRQWRPFFLLLAPTIPEVSEGRQPPRNAALADEPWPRPEKIKAAMIKSLDDSVGQLLDHLKSSGQQNNTVVLFTSANGPQKNSLVDPKFFQSTGPLRGAQGELTEGGIRVPLIAWWPARIKPGVVTEPWAAWDLFPTLEEIALLPASTNLDGLSFKTLLYTGTQTNRHEYLYWELHGDHVQQAMRLGDWKGYRPRLNSAWELYNLKDDPGETNNVADKNPGVIARMEKLLQKAHTDSSRWPLKEEAPAKEKGQP